MTFETPTESEMIAYSLRLRPERLAPHFAYNVDPKERAEFQSGKLDRDRADRLQKNAIAWVQVSTLEQANRGKLSAVLWAAHAAPDASGRAEALQAWGWPRDVPIPASALDRRRWVESWPEGFRYLVQDYRARQGAA